MLIRDSRIAVNFDTDDCRGAGAQRHCDCRVIAGEWVDPYSGTIYTDPGDLDIDHIVALENAHVSGAWTWDTQRRRDYANYLGDPEHLLAVRDTLNQSKGARGPESWKPPRVEYWCTYAAAWARIKATWQLTMTAAETAAVAEMRATCP